MSTTCVMLIWDDWPDRGRLRCNLSLWMIGLPDCKRRKRSAAIKRHAAI